MRTSEMKFADIEGIIPSEAASQILNSISLGIASFDLESLSIFSHVSSHLSHDDHLTIFTLLPNALLNYVIENYHIKFPILNTEEIPVELQTVSTEMSYKIKCNEFLYDPRTIPFPEKLDFEVILGPELVTKLGHLISATNRQQKLFNLLVDSLILTLKSIKEKPYYYEVAAATLYICYKLKDLDFSKEICEALVSEPFFDPRYCVQDQLEGFDVVDSMRSIVLEIGIFNHEYLCQILVKKWSKYPKLFAEILHRLARHSLSETGAGGLAIPICDVIPSVLLYYQQICFKSPTQEICRVRSMLFLLISHLFEHKEALIVFLSSPGFVPVYLSFVFENNLRNFVLSHIKNLLSENSIPQCLVDSIDQILAISSTYTNDEGYLKVMYDIFSMINEVLMHNKGQMIRLVPLSQRIYDILPKLSDHDLSREILIQIISFISYTAEPYSMRSVQANSIMVAIENTCQNFAPTNLASKLMQLMTGEVLVSIAPSYVVKQPHAVRLYFEACISYIFKADNFECDLTKALEAISYIDQIVTTSSANAMSVQQCGLDIYVLDLLKKAKDGPAEITEGLLTIFYKIALVVSHVNAAQRYISLLAPIKGRYIPKHQDLYLKYMNKILADSLKNPTGYLQIQDSKSAIEIYGITGDLISSGFSFSFWVFIDPAEASYKPAMLTMIDSTGKKLIWFISSQYLYLTQRTNNFESTGRVETILPALQWVLVTVSYSSTQTEAIVRTFVDSSEKKRLEFIPMNFASGNISVKIGGLESGSPGTKQFTRIAAFGMFNTLHTDQINQIYATGPQLHGIFPVKPIFAYKLVGGSDDSTLSKKYALSDIEFSMADVPRSPQTFSTSLLVYCKIEMLLPLLAQFDMTFEDGTPMNDIKMLVFEVLGHALIGNEDAQAEFHQSEGFSVVAHLLMSINASNINYQLYMQFFALLQRINGVDLIHDIIKFVMINVEILMRADAEEHLKIIRHWARVLIPSYRRFVSKCLPFRRCLSILRLYYYYTPCEAPQIMGLNRAKDLQVKDCRVALFAAAMDAASNLFTIDDFMLIIGHCLTIIEDQQVYELLEFLTSIVDRIPQQFQPLAAQIDMGSFLMSVLSRKNEKYLIATIKFLVACLRNRITSSNVLFQEEMYIMHQMSPSHATVELYDLLFDVVTKGVVELLPLITWVSMNIKGKTAELFENLYPSPNFVQHNAWSMWPVIAAFKMTDARHSILDFLSRCATLQWPPIFAMIDMVGRLLELKSDQVKADFLMNVAQTLTSTSKIQTQEIKQFFKVVKFFLFYRPTDAKNEALDGLLENAPEGFVSDFIPDNKDKNELINNANKEQDEIPIPALVLDKMINLKSDSHNYSFGIRLNKEGKWVDDIFASFCMSLFARFDPRTVFDVYFLMCSFLLHETPYIVTQQTLTLNLSESEKNSNQIFLSFVNHHSKVTIGKPIFELSIPKNIQEENAFLCLQRQHFLMDERMIQLIQQLDQFIRDFGTEINEGLIRCFSTTLDDAINVSLLDVEQSIDRNHESLAEASSKWILLWRTVAGDYGPWERITSEHKEIHYKRDNTACISFVPLKLKRNWGYDDHKKASLARDTGSKITAEARMTEDAARRAELYQQNGLIKLFEILDKPNVASPKKGDVDSKTLSGVHQLPCKIIRLRNEKDARFTLTRKFTKIEYKEGKVKFIKHNELQHIMFRRRFHRPNSMEIFTVDGRSYFIHFTEHLSLPIISKYSSIYAPNLVTLQTRDFITFMRTSKNTELWTTGRISNFEYIMHLNFMSGRSFNDLTQYPVMPWIVSNYSTPYMYLNSSEFFRDLTKPIGALGKERLSDIISRLPDLKHLGEDPYLYGSGYSCVLTVCLYLIRLEPFTSLHIDLQSGRFDHASRIFASIESAWEMVQQHLSDYRELIPEFFFMPEFLLNMNGFDFGITRGVPIGDVELPAWSSNAYEFVYLHRKALESEIVSQNLHKWIDLIWGVDSRGENAEAHHNVFKKEMYDDAWTEKTINDPVRRAEIEATMCHVGQIPPQLFKIPHPQRHTIKNIAPLIGPCMIKSYGFQNAVIARIDRGKDPYHYQASMCNAKGEYQSYIVDLGVCPNKSNSLGANRSNSNHDLLRERKSVKRSNSSESGIIEETYEIPLNKINIHNKQIKGFDSLGIKQMPKPSTVADIQLGRFAIVGNRTRKAMMVNFRTGVVEAITNVGGDAVAVCASGTHFGIATTNAIFKVASSANTQSGIDLSDSISIPSYRDSVSCCAISTQFHVSVLGTRDGFLTVSSLTTGENVRVINLGCRPQMVMITPGWGFIVAYMTQLEGGKVTHRLTLFNVNGEELRSTVLGCGLTAWHSWSSHAGFDFLVMADERGRIFCFEAFYLFPGEAVYKTGSQVVCIKHFRTISVTAVVTVEGNLVFIPHSPTDAQLY